MKRIICGLMNVVWIATIVGGCQTQSPIGANKPGNGRPSEVSAPPQLPPLAEFQLPTGTVSVLSFTNDPENYRADLGADIAWTSGGTGHYTIAFVTMMSDTAWSGFSVVFRNEIGELLWEYAVDWDPDDTTWVRTTELTVSDTLSITQSLPQGSTITEVYEFNGTQETFVYPSYIGDALRSGELSLLSAEYMAELQQLQSDFLNFYDGENTLSGNSYGILLSELLTDADFSTWVSTYSSMNVGKVVPNRTALDDAEKRKQRICDIASLCATIKCLPICGGLANPLCIPCSGVALACAVAGLIKWIFGMD